MAKKQAQTSSNKNKKYKGWIIALSTIGIASIASSIAAPLIVAANNKGGGDTPVTPEEQKSHSITITQTSGWTISGPSSAKKGDTVKFSVAQSSSNTQTTVPSAIVIKDSNYELTKNNTGTYETKDIVWPYIEQVTARLLTKTESSATVGVVFDIGSGELVSGSLSDIKPKGCTLNQINFPSFSAPEGQTFIGWSIDGSTVLTDYTFNDETTTLKAVYQNKATPSIIQHKIVFVADKDEVLAKGSRTLTIDNDTTWADVKKMTDFPVITKTGYSIGDYYVYDGTQSSELTDDYKFAFSTDTTLVVNISWTTAVYTITFKNTAKTTFASGKSEETVSANDGSSWDSVAKPVVLGTEDATSHKRYVPTSKWYTDEKLTQEFSGSITENKTLYAGWKEEATSYTYTVNFVNAYGWVDGTTEAEKQWTKTETEAKSYTWADVKSSAPESKLVYPDKKSESESAYSFKGWGIEDSTTIPEGTTNVCAQWEAKEKHYYSVVFTSDDQVAWTGSQSFWFETTDTAKTSIGDIYADIGTPTKAGSTLVGWQYTATKGGTESTKSITVSSEGDSEKMIAAFKALKFADIMDLDTAIAFKPIFEEDTTKHILYIISNDTAKGTVAAKEGFSLLSYVDNTTTISSIKSQITTTPASGYKASKYRNGATGTYFADTDVITTDTVLVVDFMEDAGGFQGKDWSEVKTACDAFEAIDTPTVDDAKTLCSALGVDASSTTKTTAKEVLEEKLVSLTGTVNVNNVEHSVRIIGAMHDTITGSTNSAALTFEFANLISDSNGYSIATFWNNTNDKTTANNDYLNSSIRKAIDGQGSGTTNWFEKDSKTFSTTYTGSVLDMLPNDLKSSLKSVSKIIYVKTKSTWTEASYGTNLFLATPKEMGYTTPNGGGTEGTSYYYYKSSTSEKRIKAQVQGSKGARTSKLSGTDLAGAYTNSKQSFAGYNSSTSGCGGNCWLSSPYTMHDTNAWPCSFSGAISGEGEVYCNAYGVAPCFCI